MTALAKAQGACKALPVGGELWYPQNHSGLPVPSQLSHLTGSIQLRTQCAPPAAFLLTPCHRYQACIISLSASAQALPNKRALVISHENVTACMYLGNEKSMLITNCLFRMGGAAVLMSNRWGLLLPLLHGQGCTACQSTCFCTPTDHSLDLLPCLLRQSHMGLSANQPHRRRRALMKGILYSAPPLLSFESRRARVSEWGGWRLSAFACALPTHVSMRRPEDASSAKYSLMHTVRTHLGRRHDAFSCMVRLLPCLPAQLAGSS